MGSNHRHVAAIGMTTHRAGPEQPSFLGIGRRTEVTTILELHIASTETVKVRKTQFRGMVASEVLSALAGHFGPNQSQRR